MTGQQAADALLFNEETTRLRLIDSMLAEAGWNVGAIAVDGDRATARCYCREIMTLKGGGLWKVVGLYTDELVRDGWVVAPGEWRRAAHRCATSCARAATLVPR